MTLTIAQIKRSLHLTEAIEKLQDELNLIYASLANAVATEPDARKRGRLKLSASGREALADAKEQRKVELALQHEAKPKRKKRRMSKEGRARIVAAQKARWARVRAGK